MEHNLSTFGTEMRASAGILALADGSTLVLVDELGRGTSPHEGLGFAAAILEKLLDTNATIFCATHFMEVLHAFEYHPQVALQHLAVQASPSPGRHSAGELVFRFKVCSGTLEGVNNYGLQVASASSLPRSLIDRAYDIQETLQRADDEQQKKSLSRAALSRYKVIVQAERKIKEVLTQAPSAETTRKCKGLQAEIVAQLLRVDEEM
ncbi:unnamed protein product [Sympodiomycopsis kandeliae]